MIISRVQVTVLLDCRYNVKLKGCCKDLVRDLKLIWYSSEINGKRFSIPKIFDLVIIVVFLILIDLLSRSLFQGYFKLVIITSLVTLISDWAALITGLVSLDLISDQKLPLERKFFVPWQSSLKRTGSFFYFIYQKARLQDWCNTNFKSNMLTFPLCFQQNA